MHHEFISRKQYLEWVNQKKVIDINKNKEEESERDSQVIQEENTDTKTA